jgi:hypothetical protein
MNIYPLRFCKSLSVSLLLIIAAISKASGQIEGTVQNVKALASKMGAAPARVRMSK